MAMSSQAEKHSATYMELSGGKTLALHNKGASHAPFGIPLLDCRHETGRIGAGPGSEDAAGWAWHTACLETRRIGSSAVHSGSNEGPSIKQRR